MGGFMLPVLGIVLLVGSADDCFQFFSESFSQQLLIDRSNCFMIQHCFFFDIEVSSPDAFGGAICWNTTVSGNLLEDCTFSNCRTTALWTAGGGCAIRSPDLTLSRCCGFHCSSSRGQFLYFETRPKAFVTDLWCFDCAPLSIVEDRNKIEIYGSVTADHDVNVDFSVCNFSRSRTWIGSIKEGGGATYADGSAVTLYGRYADDDATSRLDYCTIFECSGRTCIYSGPPRRPVLSYCNFYSNHMSEPLIWCVEGLVRCEFCYFSGNYNVEFGAGGNPSGRISLSNCYFDGSLPTGDFYTDCDDSYDNAIFTSFPISHHHVALCAGFTLPTPVLDYLPFSLHPLSFQVPSDFHLPADLSSQHFSLN
jgi:hypothetical protein